MENETPDIISRLMTVLEQLGGVRRASMLYEREVNNPINVTVIRKLIYGKRDKNFTYMLVYILEKIYQERQQLLAPTQHAEHQELEPNTAENS